MGNGKIIISNTSCTVLRAVALLGSNETHYKILLIRRAGSNCKSREFSHERPRGQVCHVFGLFDTSGRRRTLLSVLASLSALIDHLTHFVRAQ